ncbi:MAG TPA: ABC transporter ATP-binding protein [Devosia sp.]|nr:ABC transporter ATP-binding protein [Devosia sp.]
MTAPAAANRRFSFGRLIGWALAATSGIAGPFILVTVLAILTTLLSQYNAQLITNFTGMLQGGPAHGPTSGFNLVALLLPADVGWTAILFAVTAILLIGFGFANRVGSTWYNTLMQQRLQLRLHNKLLEMGPGYHADHDMGENTALVMQYPAMAQPMLRDVLAFPFVRGVALISAAVLLYYNLRGLGSQDVVYVMLAVLLVLLPAGGVWLSSRLRGVYGSVRDRQNALNNVLVDSLTAPQEVQLMDAGAQRAAAFDAELTILRRAQVRASVQRETSGQYLTAVPVVLQVGLILWAVFVAGGAAVPAVIAIYFFVPRVVDPIRELIEFYANLNTAWPNIERIGDVLEAPPEVADTGKRGAADLRSHEVGLDAIVFRPADRTVLDGISKRFTPGRITAIVGRSGSGKSTIMRLVSRLFDPTGGRITIGGIDIRELELKALREVTATVSQFPLFIEAGVRENLRLGAPAATDAQMEEACRAADLWDALVRISPADPLATPVPRQAGKAGLAGGERRRLAIARTLLSDARILLLDEPSTGIDALSITRILHQFRSQPDRTILLVDHDMDLISAVADEICCIEDGKFTDIGTPAELLARPTLFKSLWDARRSYGTDNLEVTGSVPVRPAQVPAGQAAATAARPAAASPARDGGRPMQSAVQGVPNG